MAPQTIPILIGAPRSSYFLPFLSYHEDIERKDHGHLIWWWNYFPKWISYHQIVPMAFLFPTTASKVCGTRKEEIQVTARFQKESWAVLGISSSSSYLPTTAFKIVRSLWWRRRGGRGKTRLWKKIADEINKLMSQFLSAFIFHILFFPPLFKKGSVLPPHQRPNFGNHTLLSRDSRGLMRWLLPSS